MAQSKTKKKSTSLEDRFEFVGDALAASDISILRPAVFLVENRATGAEHSLKLWRKTKTSADFDLRSLWLHEMRQVQRVMSYAGAREVIVEIVELVEDDEHFGMLLERAGHPLEERQRYVSRQHWLKTLGAPRARSLFWRNMRRIAQALGIIHAQGLIHGRVSRRAILTEALDEPDFQLGEFEWSLWVSTAQSEQSHANLGSGSRSLRSGQSYSFAEDWRAFGSVAVETLGFSLDADGNAKRALSTEATVDLQTAERTLLKRLAAPSRTDELDAETIIKSIDDIVAQIGKTQSTASGSFVLRFDSQSNLAETIYEASDGQIAVDEYKAQLDWVRADLDGGSTLLIPRDFDPGTHLIRLITNFMVYKLRGSREAGAPVWDIAVCIGVVPRERAGSFGDFEEHQITQEIIVATSRTRAEEQRSSLGPSALDWIALAAPPTRENATATEKIRHALVLVQIIEALVKALEIYPVEILDVGRRDGRPYVFLRAQPNSDRDRIAKRIGMIETSTSLMRLFDEENVESEGRWRLSQAASLGATQNSDVLATFIEATDHRGRRAYQFELDEDLPDSGPFFLRTERDTGTEKVIERRLRNIRGLESRIDLTAMLSDPWATRRSSKDGLSDEDRKDALFLDLDRPKQEALSGLWSTLPVYLVVGPPGVGKTKLATEVVRRRFKRDASARLLISAQGHDALDNLQNKIIESFAKVGLDDIMVVRSTTPDARATSDEEIHLAGQAYLEKLASSSMAKAAPVQIKTQIDVVAKAAGQLRIDKQSLGRVEKGGLGAVSHLVLDAANVVITTANSSDIEQLVEAREQFDWVIIEEAAKALGPELVGPLMLSGRRLLIGDHDQLAPFGAERLLHILTDYSLVEESIRIAAEIVAPIFRDGEMDELEDVARDPAYLKSITDEAVRLLEPFRTFVEEDARRKSVDPDHRAISSLLSEQRRMDPAIAEIVSKAFYKGKLETEARRANATPCASLSHIGALPNSPVVVINFPHVSRTGRAEQMERGRPRWHNPAEIDSVIDILRQLRAKTPLEKEVPTLAILTPYQAQVQKLRQRIAPLRAGLLKHLDDFAPVRTDGEFVGTVDSFQGSEADVVILSTVRNNPGTGVRALGFLRDRRRMNVAISRAKQQLFVVGSIEFLREAVRGVNPDADSTDLSFLTDVANAIDDLAKRSRAGRSMATVISPNAIKARP